MNVKQLIDMLEGQNQNALVVVAIEQYDVRHGDTIYPDGLGVCNEDYVVIR